MKSFQSIDKTEVDTILVANEYILKCKFDNKCSEKTSLARKYLTSLINRALKQKIENKIKTSSLIY